MPRVIGRVRVTRKVTIRPRITRRSIRFVCCPRCGRSHTGYSIGASFLCACGQRVRVV